MKHALVSLSEAPVAPSEVAVEAKAVGYESDFLDIRNFQ
jgi:hypothetical protein